MDALKDKLMLSYHPGRQQPYSIWITLGHDGNRVVRFCRNVFEVRWWTEKLRRELAEEPSGVRR